MRIPFISLIAAGSIALGGCAYGDLGVGMGYGNGYYGSYGTPYYGAYGNSYYGYGSGYGDPWYGGYGGYGSYGSPSFGWYDNYYYPGSGYYVYDSYRRPHMWSSRQQSYWTSRQRNSGTRVVSSKADWSGFTTRSSTSSVDRATTREDRQDRRRDRVPR